MCVCVCVCNVAAEFEALVATFDPKVSHGDDGGGAGLGAVPAVTSTPEGAISEDNVSSAVLRAAPDR